MFLFEKKTRLNKARLRATPLKKGLFAGLVLLFMAGSLFVSCTDPGSDPGDNPVNAQQPSITAQPTGGTWNVTNENTFTLTVTAAVTDEGALSYQWYSNAINSTTGGAVIGTNNAELTIDKEDYNAGDTLYFYVVVTNTISDNGDGGSKTATATSNAATVTVTEVVIPAGLDGYFQTPLGYYAWGWVDDGFAVDRNAKTFWYYHDSTMENGWGGIIVSHTPEDDDADEPAILIVRVTEIKGDSWVSPELEGRYFAAAYKNLAVDAGGNMVSSATAYSSSVGAKNDGVVTLAEAVSEYTAANEYFKTYGTYIQHPVTAVTLGDLKGNWQGDEDEGMEDYYIIIRGTTFTEFLDDYEAEDDLGVYVPDTDDMLASMGDIVDCTDTAQTSGVLYLKVIDGGYVFSNGKFIAVAWQNKDGGGIEFATGNTEKDTLAEIKSQYANASAFPAGSFNAYGK